MLAHSTEAEHVALQMRQTAPDERTSRRFALDGDVPWYIEMLLKVMVEKGSRDHQSL